eukprot:COSAG06_NODE_6898_length_2724_cov_45.057143_1_plen_91_part_10
MARPSSRSRLRQVARHLDGRGAGSSSGIVDMDFFAKNGVRSHTRVPPLAPRRSIVSPRLSVCHCTVQLHSGSVRLRVSVWFWLACAGGSAE